MDIDCVPARVTLGVITLLTVSGLVSGNVFALNDISMIYCPKIHDIIHHMKPVYFFYLGEKGGIPQTSYVKVSMLDMTSNDFQT